MTTAIHTKTIQNSRTKSIHTRRGRARTVMTLLIGLLVLAVLMGLGLGAVRVTPPQIGVILLDKLGVAHGFVVEYGMRESGVLVTIRLPRVLLGLLVGAALGISGAAIQGLFRNPLAAPGLIGISSGAALAAVSVIVLGATLFEGLSRILGHFTLPVAAFVGGVSTTLIIYKEVSDYPETIASTGKTKTKAFPQYVVV